MISKGGSDAYVKVEEIGSSSLGGTMGEVVIGGTSTEGSTLSFMIIVNHPLVFMIFVNHPLVPLWKPDR